MNDKHIPLDEVQSRAHTLVSDKWLADEQHLHKVFQLITIYRRNFDIFAEHYLGIRLHLYQKIILHLLGKAKRVAAICSRATAKSFIIALYCVIVAILYPGSNIVLFADKRGQAKKIITEKIARELVPLSPMLRREIEPVRGAWIHNSGDTVRCSFKNGSAIQLVTLSQTARGTRSTLNVAEEAREINKDLYDEVAMPFTMARQAQFLTRPEYAGRKEFLETAPEVIISSSFPESNWVYGEAVNIAKEMASGKPSLFIALDNSVSLAHGIKTREQLLSARKTMDPITWKVEHENAVLRENERSFFSYDMLSKRQTLRQAFYPARNGKPATKIPKVPGELRIVVCDIAAINKSENDNSVFRCMRLLPEEIGKSLEFRAQDNYIESSRGYELSRQAVRIRQLDNDFEADYIVLDVANNGLAVYQSLARVLYDEDRDVEYAPIRAMNNDGIAGTVQNSGCPERVFCISASAKLNSDIAVNANYYFSEGLIELLVHRNAVTDEISQMAMDLINPSEERFELEKPYLETLLTISEMVELTYERGQNTGIITLREVAGRTKDRYVSLAYGLFFARQRANELCDSPTHQATNMPILVSQISLEGRW